MEGEGVGLSHIVKTILAYANQEKPAFLLSARNKVGYELADRASVSKGFISLTAHICRRLHELTIILKEGDRPKRRRNFDSADNREPAYMSWRQG